MDTGVHHSSFLIYLPSFFILFRRPLAEWDCKPVQTGGQRKVRPNLHEEFPSCFHSFSLQFL